MFYAVFLWAAYMSLYYNIVGFFIIIEMIRMNLLNFKLLLNDDIPADIWTIFCQKGPSSYLGCLQNNPLKQIWWYIVLDRYDVLRIDDTK